MVHQYLAKWTQSVNHKFQELELSSNLLESNWHTSNWLNSENITNIQLGELTKLSQSAKAIFHTMGLTSWTPLVSRGGFNGAPWLSNLRGSHLKESQ